MANYATQSDMEDRYGTEEVKLAADRDGDGVVDPDAITSCLTAATGEINTYVQAQYELPLSVVSEHLEHICCDIAMYKLSADSPAYTDEKRVRYDDAIAWLTKLAKGIVSLGDETSDDEQQTATEISDITQDRLFTRTTLRNVL